MSGLVGFLRMRREVGLDAAVFGKQGLSVSDHVSNAERGVGTYRRRWRRLAPPDGATSEDRIWQCQFWRGRPYKGCPPPLEFLVYLSPESQVIVGWCAGGVAHTPSVPPCR